MLGTSFNVKAYTDEPAVGTTLLEGAVRVRSDGPSLLLEPGQQARVDPAGTVRLVKAVDTNKVMAWKHGSFNFQEKSLEEVMRQLARWYDIEVIYQKKAPDIEFFGEMGRNLNLSQVLEGLKGAGVNFKIEEGRRLIVMP